MYQECAMCREHQCDLEGVLKHISEMPIQERIKIHTKLDLEINELRNQLMVAKINEWYGKMNGALGDPSIKLLYNTDALLKEVGLVRVRDLPGSIQDTLLENGYKRGPLPQ